ncbi:MAG: N-acetylmuramoyl-L-alanine amidase [Sandaracinus sp.]|nr:N-acetylmuramoyl-L-alanine amidase [Sandaracinus sp.]
MRIAVLALVLWSSPTLAQRIVIDAGHGGTDPGAVGCGLEEQAVVLDIAQRTATLLRDAGFTVDLTRSDDRSVSLSARTSFANSRGADRFVSIHANSNAGTPATGSETFAYTTPGSTSLNLRDRIQEEMIRAWGLRDRGGKLANFHVLRETTMPAALSETAFINNCGTDARYLGDATRRAQMAEAHYRAILRHYGRTPGTVTPPMPSTGTLLGVIFEDSGRGLEDTSTRVSGAAVALDGRGERATSADGTGAWSFSLPAGSYTVVATRDGFVEARRTCDVSAGGETWCSVGLVRTRPPEPEDAGAPDVDAGVPVEEDAGTVPTVGTDAGEEVEVDAGIVPPERVAASGGCSATGGATGFGLWLFVGFFALFRRRRAALGRAALSALAGLVAVGCATESREGTSAALLDETQVTRIELAREVAPFASIEGVATLHSDRRFLAVEVAPTADRFALSAAGFATLYVADETTIRTLAQGPARGFAPRWRADGRAVGVRTPGQSESAVPHLAFDLEGGEVAPITEPDGALTWIADDVVRVDVRGQRHDVPLPGDRPFDPRLSPDRRFVAFRGLSTGLYVHELATGRTLHLGEGGHARFSASSRHVVFERIVDDGHETTSATLWIADLDAGVTAPLTGGSGFDTSPSLATNGTLAWLRDEVLHVGRLHLR